MCCSAKKFATQELRKKMKKAGGKVSFWKVIKNNKTSVMKSYYIWNKGIHRSGVNKFGWNKYKDSDDVYLSGGFHVFTDKAGAMDMLAFYRCVGLKSAVSLLEVTCDEKDLSGAEEQHLNTSAVFTKVEVTNRQWDNFNRSVRRCEKGK